MANTLTLIRIALILPLVICLMQDALVWRWLAVGLFVLAGISDFLDGFIARRTQTTSALGAALDPIADKLLTAAVLLMLIADGTLTGFDMILGLIMILREIWISGLREALAGRTPLVVTALAKWKTAAQFLALGFLLMPVTSLSREAGIFFLWAAAALTIWTGAQYTHLAIGQLSGKSGR
ncbi:CDP-diacylglycerol--glycerol-3-phosphate 3-phosphatidyltransferase [Parvularcula sp. IMCC14364]|uniref:CDP-diacylglycerol--glycerol-3-phosphate 3-phosphatidyltransferase n=1 Tax=Parvularcula sp. IMCC14364 TaxID=3067902 RepID=UPI0027426394|nr:CDP-diacylglycerol--glycerol-3-phosphate 3-phosphatidyltransferase [Parvularcula sp. IMCC14364]